MTYYFAVLAPIKDEGYYVFFPDFPEAATQGKDLENAMYMAQDALKISLAEYAKEGRKFPEPSTLADVRKKEIEELESLEITPCDECLRIPFPAPSIDTTPVKLTISLPKNVLSTLDLKAKLAGATRSGYIARLVTA